MTSFEFVIRSFFDHRFEKNGLTEFSSLDLNLDHSIIDYELIDSLLIKI